MLLKTKKGLLRQPTESSHGNHLQCKFLTVVFSFQFAKIVFAFRFLFPKFRARSIPSVLWLYQLRMQAKPFITFLCFFVSKQLLNRIYSAEENYWLRGIKAKKREKKFVRNPILSCTWVTAAPAFLPSVLEKLAPFMSGFYNKCAFRVICECCFSFLITLKLIQRVLIMLCRLRGLI